MSPRIRVEVETTAVNRDLQLGGNGTDYTFYERQWTEDDEDERRRARWLIWGVVVVVGLPGWWLLFKAFRA
ncbi:hypothetical protein LTR95_002114 [Oleoguttula sp. CCFEE 5521]